MAIQPSQPQTIGGVLDTTFQLYKASVIAVLPMSLILAVGGALPSIYMMWSGGAANPADAAGMITAMSTPGYMPKFILTYLLTMLVTLWGMAAMYLKMNSIGSGAALTLGESLQATLGRAPLLLLMSILYFIAIVIGTILLIVPGVILAVSLVLAMPLMVLEHKGPVGSLTGSHALVWGNWWRTLAIGSVVFVIFFVIYMAVAMVVGVAMPLLLAGADAIAAAMILTVVVGALVNLLVMPFFTAALLATYWDLKLRKEGGDLAARVGALGAA